MDIPKRKNIKNTVKTGEYAANTKGCLAVPGTSWEYHYVVVSDLANFDAECLD